MFNCRHKLSLVEQISSSTEVINHEYTYSGEYGVHAVNVRGFNLANNDTISTDVEVLEWPCQPLNVSVDVDPEVPLMVESEYGFIINATFAVDCMKNERFSLRWDLSDSDDIHWRTLANASQLIVEPYLLPAGVYLVNVTASLWSSYFDLSDKKVEISLTVNVTATQLVTGFDTDSFIDAEFNQTIHLSTYNRTYDPMAPSSTGKSGMMTEWRCKRSDEDWPLEPMPNQSYVPFSGVNGGCFDSVGPGVLRFADGLWDLVFDTSYLEPLVNYTIQFVVNKGDRTASTDVAVWIQQPLVPLLTIKLVNLICFSLLTVLVNTFCREEVMCQYVGLCSLNSNLES